MVNAKSLKNLRKFVPGQVANPKGSKCYAATVVMWWNTFVDRKQDELVEISEDADAPIAKRTAARIVLDGFTGKLDALREILDRTGGKPKQSVDHTSDGEKISFTLRIGERDVVNDN